MNVGIVHYEPVLAGAPGRRSKNVARGYFKLAFYLADRTHSPFRNMAGVHVVDGSVARPPHPKLCLHVCPAHMFRPIEGKVNVLFSMWESDVLPTSTRAALAPADWHIVPSRYCQRVWRAAGLEAAYVPLGVDEGYTVGDAGRPILDRSRVLRFLWIGSRLERKGWELIAPAWSMAFKPADPAELYLKTVGSGELENYFGGRIVIDKRDLDEQGLAELYRSADVFVFPSMGEGFGLPALEAMASGCLVLAPATTGLAEFVEPSTAVCLPTVEARANYGADYVGHFPTIEGLAQAMRAASSSWGTPALETIRRTGANYARRFTWKATAARLALVLEAIASEKGIAAVEKSPLETVH